MLPASASAGPKKVTALPANAPALPKVLVVPASVPAPLPTSDWVVLCAVKKPAQVAVLMDAAPPPEVQQIPRQVQVVETPTSHVWLVYTLI